MNPGRCESDGVDVDFVELPSDGRAAGRARSLVRERLRGWQLDELVDTTVLLASEVVANVIVHTSSAPSLCVARDGAGVRVSVADGSTVPPRHRRHSATATTGRGLEMLVDLADEWGWDPVEGGKVVWFLLRGGPEARPGAPAGGPEPVPAAAGPVSPLGRYAGAEDGTGAAGAAWAPEATVRVDLLGVPVRVLAAAREHHDGLLRELRLLALSGSLAGRDAPVRLVELTQELGMRYAAARPRPDAEVDRALQQGLDTVDLVYRVPPSVVDGARLLAALMDEADEFCRSAQLMTLPRAPVVLRFSAWYLDQFADQVAGRPAVRWDGPLDVG